MAFREPRGEGAPVLTQLAGLARWLQVVIWRLSVTLAKMLLWSKGSSDGIGLSEYLEESRHRLLTSSFKKVGYHIEAIDRG